MLSYILDNQSFIALVQHHTINMWSITEILCNTYYNIILKFVFEQKMMNLSALIVFNNLLSNTILSSTCRLLIYISQRYFHIVCC